MRALVAWWAAMWWLLRNGYEPLQEQLLNALAATLIIAVSIAIHELAHAICAYRLKCRVERIVLFLSLIHI